MEHKWELAATEELRESTVIAMHTNKTDQERVEAIRDYLQKRVPEKKVTITEIIRFALFSASERIRREEG